MRNWFIALLAVAGFVLFQISGAVAQADVDKPVLVELFTSEGCSSCPPADILLQRLDRQPIAGVHLIVLSEHVDYWNHLGWKDPYSSRLYSERQSIYARRFGLDGPYTPQMVLNGRDQFVGSDGSALERALRNDARREHFGLRIVSSVPAREGIDVKFAFAGNPLKPLDILAVLADDADRSNVLRGENGGRKLQHVSVARSIARVATVTDDGEHSVHISFPEGFPTSSGTGHHLILFAQEQRQGAILGATTMPL